jgi:hypothetical protein
VEEEIFWVPVGSERGLNIFKVFTLSMAKHTKHFQIKTVTKIILKYQGW